MTLNILLSHTRLLKVIVNDTVEYGLCKSLLVFLVLGLVHGDDELQSQSAVDAHIFPMLVQTVFTGRCVYIGLA